MPSVTHSQLFMTAMISCIIFSYRVEDRRTIKFND